MSHVTLITEPPLSKLVLDGLPNQINVVVESAIKKNQKQLIVINMQNRKRCMVQWLLGVILGVSREHANPAEKMSLIFST